MKDKETKEVPIKDLTPQQKLELMSQVYMNGFIELIESTKLIGSTGDPIAQLIYSSLTGIRKWMFYIQDNKIEVQTAHELLDHLRSTIDIIHQIAEGQLPKKPKRKKWFGIFNNQKGQNVKKEKE